MFRNYLKIAWRGLRKYPTTTLIHILGLTVGLTACLLIGLFIQYEWAFDRFEPAADRIYRVVMSQKTGNDVEQSGITPYPLGNALHTDFPEWTTVASIHAEEHVGIKVSPTKLFSEKRVLFAEPAVFTLFDFRMIVGDAKQILSQPNQVILSETTAKNYFGSVSPIGKTFRLGEKIMVQVTGIMRDMPAQTHLNAPMIVSYKTLKSYFPFPLDQWGLRSAGSVYVVLPEGREPAQYADRLRQVTTKYFASQDKGSSHELLLQPLHDIHFNPAFGGSVYVPAIVPTYLWVFGAIGLFILLIACINFVNMATARATTRAREVGVRKVIGATGGQLVGQFLAEAFYLTLFSALLSALFAALLLPELNSFLHKQVSLDWPGMIGFLVVLALLTTLIAGLYPALFLARFEPIKALKSRLLVGAGRVRLRQALVVFQFSVSLVLAVGVLVIYQQMKLFREKDLGFSRNAILTIEAPNAGQTMTALYPQLSQLAGVEQVSFALGAPTSENRFTTGMIADLSKPNQRVNIDLKLADANYLNTYGLKLLAGRFFTYADTLATAATLPADQRRYAFVVNEKTVQALGYARPEQALGHEVQIGLNDISAKIIGVVRNFHSTSLHEEIQPMVMVNFPGFYQMAGVKLSTTNYASVLASIEKIWKQQYPDTLFDAQFLDASLQKLYDEESRQFTLLRIFSGLALLICCLGLWGLATFTIEQRTKEIGVRKVLGASVASIIGLLSKDFLKLVGIAIVIASPLAWYAMSQWLKDFAYRIDIEWWMFALAGLVAVTIALLTVSFQSVKAALMNPVKSLRSE